MEAGTTREDIKQQRGYPDCHKCRVLQQSEPRKTTISGEKKDGDQAVIQVSVPTTEDSTRTSLQPGKIKYLLKLIPHQTSTGKGTLTGNTSEYSYPLS